MRRVTMFDILDFRFSRMGRWKSLDGVKRISCKTLIFSLTLMVPYLAIQ